jgi:hypothetical protein
MPLLGSSFHSNTNKFPYTVSNYFHGRENNKSICVRVTRRILLVININSRASDCRVITCGLEHRTTVIEFSTDQEFFFLLLQNFRAGFGAHWALYSMRMQQSYCGRSLNSITLLCAIPSLKGYNQGRFSQHARSYLKIQGLRRVIWSRFHTEDPQILGGSAQNLVATTNWRQVFVRPCV